MYTSTIMYKDITQLHARFWCRKCAQFALHCKKLNNCHDNYPINLGSQRGVQRIMIISRQKGPVGCGEVRLSHDGRGGRGTKINGERERESQLMSVTTK